MNVPPYLIIPAIHTGGFGQKVFVGTPFQIPANPSRIYLAIMYAAAANIFCVPQIAGSNVLGYRIKPTDQWIEFTFATHPGLVNAQWLVNTDTTVPFDWIELSFKPES